jgi:hypothetical protein
VVLGCARAREDTTGFEVVDETTINAPFDETWQATKSALREMDLLIYTRDKRGSFVAYSEAKRRLRLLTPRRKQITITLEENGSESTNISIETIQQVYGVTIMTYPDWHSRETADNSEAVAIMDAVRAKLS